MDRPSRCLVLGGKGFIGSHLVDALLERGFRVRSFDRPNLASLRDAPHHADRFESIDGDFASDADIAAAVADCDTCYHLISTTLPKSSNADPVFDVETNLLGTLRLLNHAVRGGMRKIVFISSGGTVYGRPARLPIDEEHATNPICSYGVTKLAIEKYLGMYLDLHGLDYTVLRVSNPYGERQRTHASQGVIAVFLSKALRGEALEIWGDGSVVRDYIHISDVVAALVAALSYRGEERVFNIGSGYGTSLNQVADAIRQATGRAVACRYLSARAFDVPASVLSIARAEATLCWKPRVSLPEGLGLTVRWLERQPATSAEAASFSPPPMGGTRERH